MIVSNKTGIVEIDGVDGKMLKLLANDLNFTVNYVIVEENLRWGEIFSNRNASGAMGLVSRCNFEF
jgi:hypothetical protein